MVSQCANHFSIENKWVLLFEMFDFFILIVTVQASLLLLTTIMSAYLQVYLTFHFDRLNQRPLNKEESLHHSVVTPLNVTRSKENKESDLITKCATVFSPI